MKVNKYSVLQFLTLAFGLCFYAHSQEYTSIPDARFEQALSLYDDVPEDHKIPTRNIENLYILDVSSYNISNLQGIEAFVSLVYLNCSRNYIESLDLSQNKKLKTLNVSSNLLKVLDVTQNPLIEELYCSENEISALDVSQNTELSYLYCDHNKLEELDLYNNHNLIYLHCHFNKLALLDLSRQESLTRLFCQSNELVKLNIQNGNNKNLVSFSSDHNPNLNTVFLDSDMDYKKTQGSLSILNLKKVKNVINSSRGVGMFTNIPDSKFEQALIDLGIDSSGDLDGKLMTSDIENVESLDVSGKGITDLTGIQGFKDLKSLNCSNNLLSSLDLYETRNLVNLDCSRNSISTLLLVKNTEMITVDCSFNKLSVLDLTNHSKLQRLNCSGNQISDLNLTKNVDLVDLVCSDNQVLKQAIIKGVSVQF